MTDQHLFIERAMHTLKMMGYDVRQIGDDEFKYRYSFDDPSTVTAEQLIAFVQTVYPSTIWPDSLEYQYEQHARALFERLHDAYASAFEYMINDPARHVQMRMEEAIDVIRQAMMRAAGVMNND